MLKGCGVTSLVDELWGKLPWHCTSISVDGGLQCRETSWLPWPPFCPSGSLKGVWWMAALVVLRVLFFCTHPSVQTVLVNTITTVKLYLVSLDREMLHCTYLIIGEVQKPLLTPSSQWRKISSTVGKIRLCCLSALNSAFLPLGDLAAMVLQFF